MSAADAQARAREVQPATEAAPAPPRPRRRVRWLAPRRDIPDRAYVLLAVLSFVGAAAAWPWLSAPPFVNPVFIPSPRRVLAEFGTLFTGDQWADVRISFLRVTAGFLLSAALAIPIGIAIGAFKVGEGLLQPFTEFVRYIPVPALIPILIVLCGIGESPKIMLIFIGTFFQLVLMVADEIRRVPYDLVQVGYTLGARRGEIVTRILLPAAMPGIFDALRLCNGWAWTYLVVAELVASNEGLGYRILKFGRYIQTPKIFVYLIILGIIGLTLDLIFRRLNRAAFHWAEKERG
jgi:NitT/TauT family transport system permease protein